jgi:hypothetical protein
VTFSYRAERVIRWGVALFSKTLNPGSKAAETLTVRSHTGVTTSLEVDNCATLQPVGRSHSRSVDWFLRICREGMSLAENDAIDKLNSL